MILWETNCTSRRVSCLLLLFLSFDFLIWHAREHHTPHTYGITRMSNVNFSIQESLCVWYREKEKEFPPTPPLGDDAALLSVLVKRVWTCLPLAKSVPLQGGINIKEFGEIGRTHTSRRRELSTTRERCTVESVAQQTTRTLVISLLHRFLTLKNKENGFYRGMQQPWHYFFLFFCISSALLLLSVICMSCSFMKTIVKILWNRLTKGCVVLLTTTSNRPFIFFVPRLPWLTIPLMTMLMIKTESQCIRGKATKQVSLQKILF